MEVAVREDEGQGPQLDEVPLGVVLSPHLQMVHQAVHHGPDLRPGLLHGQHPERGDGGVDRVEGVLVGDGDLGLYVGEDGALGSVDWTILTVSSTQRDVTLAALRPRGQAGRDVSHSPCNPSPRPPCNTRDTRAENRQMVLVMELLISSKLNKSLPTMAGLSMMIVSKGLMSLAATTMFPLSSL